MHFSHRMLRKEDVTHAAQLDKKWFGSHGISEEQLSKIVATSPDLTLGVFSSRELLGFAIFELLDATMLPSDYFGNFPEHSSVLFLQQFTTNTNCQIGNMSSDEALLSAVEQTARRLKCEKIWEALSVDHPFSTKNNSQHDTFGFYEKNGYTINAEKVLWRPNSLTTIPCFLLSKSCAI
ncbi:MAG: hypothetical protein O2840_00450 [bacterium]|nr:hypothetical protein [bacterium]